jgi:hypothetical protein
MIESLQRITSIVLADFKFRFRRTAAVVTMLVVAAGVYFIVPDLSTGRTLMQVGGGRVFYTSAAVALGTGMFCTMFISVIGFYIVSNSLRRDILTRTGFVVAATPVTSTEYILGKFAGNFLYLAAIALTCMTSTMVMFLFRGEASLEPLTFLRIYAWLAIPSIAFCSSVAIAFEALPLLSGRFGDVLYFLVWGGLLGVSGAYIDSHGSPGWMCMFDIVGIVSIIGFLREQFNVSSMSIGFSSFDASHAPILLIDMPLGGQLLLQRFSSLLLVAGFLTLARVWFHRFNPTRVKFSVRHARRNLFVRLNTLLKPATRVLRPFSALSTVRQQRASLFGAVRADVLATLELSPFVILAIVVFAILSLTLDTAALRSGVLPAAVIAIVIAVADIATRDHAAGTKALLFTAPHLKPNYVLWKCCSAFVIVLFFTGIPLVRIAFAAPNSAFSLLIGSVFMAATAIGFGVLTNSQKPFMATFLMLLYITLNAKEEAVFDFAGIYGRATAGVHAGYALLSVVCFAGAALKHKRSLNT